MALASQNNPQGAYGSDTNDAGNDVRPQQQTICRNEQHRLSKGRVTTSGRDEQHRRSITATRYDQQKAGTLLL